VFLPRKPHVERDIVIAMHPALVFQQVSNPKRFNGST
jgi:hypothetical protein